MKDKLVAAGDRVTPGLMARLRGNPWPTRRALMNEFATLRDEVRELRDEIDECRRDNTRIAELTEIVETRLAATPAP